jgi:hypothetical protein
LKCRLFGFSAFQLFSFWAWFVVRVEHDGTARMTFCRKLCKTAKGGSLAGRKAETLKN